MTTETNPYPARLRVDFPDSLDRLSTGLRLVWALPVVLLVAILSAGSSTATTTMAEGGGEVVSRATESGGGIAGALFLATSAMIVIRQKYPRWWFDFSLEFSRFSSRVGAYLGLLTDRYPSTTDQQSVHLELDYPNVDVELNRWMPLVKWLLAVPHYALLVVLVPAALLAIAGAWIAILFTGRYPAPLFEFVVGVGRWALRVQAYAFLLITDRYPPFRLAA